MYPYFLLQVILRPQRVPVNVYCTPTWRPSVISLPAAVLLPVVGGAGTVLVFHAASMVLVPGGHQPPAEEPLPVVGGQVFVLVFHHYLHGFDLQAGM